MSIQALSVGSSPVLQSKTVSPTSDTQIIQPDSRYDGLSKVTVWGTDKKFYDNVESVELSDLTYSIATNNAFQLRNIVTLTWDVTNVNTFKRITISDIFMMYMTATERRSSNYYWRISWRYFWDWGNMSNGGGGFSNMDGVENNIQLKVDFTTNNNYITKFTITFYINSSYYSNFTDTFSRYFLELRAITYKP